MDNETTMPGLLTCPATLHPAVAPRRIPWLYKLSLAVAVLALLGLLALSF